MPLHPVSTFQMKLIFNILFIFLDKNTFKNKVLIMDEVDGMAGNEDRGGVAELINLIKHTKIPIICICNDRQHPKIRSLVHYCLDLRFYKLNLEPIRVSTFILF